MSVIAPRHAIWLRLAFLIMELYLAMAVGAMTGFGFATVFTVLHGRWWVSIPAGIAGGLAGRALWGEPLAGMLEDSALAGTAVAAALGGALFGLVATVAHRIVESRMSPAPQE